MSRSSSSGQAALILIMIMAVVGAVSVSVASQSVENLRTQEIENTSSQSFRAAEAALEVALNSKSDVPTTALPGGIANYSATYSVSGTDGFVADGVEEGDVVQTSLVGAIGITALNIYWNTNSAIKVSVLSGAPGTGYAVTYYTSDPDAARRLTNNFSASAVGGSFKTMSFDNKLVVPINLAATPKPVLVRINVLYQKSNVGVEPVGGTLATGQTVSVNAVGTAANNVVTNLSFSKFSERVPEIFENVLYSNSSITQ